MDASFGRLVKLRRRALDLTQEDLARRVGYSVVTIRKLESNERRPSRQLAERLAHSLDLAVEEREAFVVFARGRVAPQVVDGLADPSPPSTYVDAIIGARDRAVRPPRPGNLVAPLTRLIGRESAVAAVRGMLARPGVRLVTLVGPPGIGKSRLSVHVAAELADADACDGVFLVALAPLNDAALVAATIAQTVGATDLDATCLVDSLIAHLAGRRLLLVLDNFEHVISGAPVVAQLLAACPGLRVLATSREPLRLRGEHLYVVSPLALPEPSMARSADAAARFSAVQLFVERAQAANPEFALSDDNAGVIAQICARVDGVPLSIELVAVRSRLLAPALLLSRLDHRLVLLTDGPQDLPPRQQTLRAALDWSYELLEPFEQTIFARVGVFPGGCTIEAADRVVAAPGDDPPVLDVLAALVDKNLVRDELRAGDQLYFVMLETIREYALERLAAGGEQERVSAAFADYYLALAVQAGPQLIGDRQGEWLERLDAEQANLRAVLEWYATRRLAEPALRFVAALWRYWHIRSHQTDAVRWITLVLALDPPDDAHPRANACYGAGWIALDRGDNAQARAHFAESLALFRELGCGRGVAEALHGVATMARAEGEHDEAGALLSESLALYRELGDDEGIAWSLDQLGVGALDLQEYDQAQRLFEEGLELFGRQSHAWGTAILLHHVGVAALARGEYDTAVARLEQAMAAFGELANTWGVASCLTHLGFAALARADHATARSQFTRALAHARADSDVSGMAGTLSALASLALEQGERARAAYLIGAVEAVIDSSRVRMNPYERTRYEQNVAAVAQAAKTQSPDGDPARALAQGRATPLSTVAAEALGATWPELPRHTSNEHHSE